MKALSTAAINVRPSVDAQIFVVRPSIFSAGSPFSFTLKGFIMTETQDQYLDRICALKPKKKRKTKQKDDPDQIIFGYKWKDIQAMQQGTYKRKAIK